jgi:outer membrane protein
MTMSTTRLAGAALATLLATSVHAQSAGSILARIGVTQIRPDVTSGDLTAPSPAGTKVDVKAATQLGGGITYMLTDQWAIDVPLALPFKHELVGDGAIAGSGKIGETKALPITVLGQYRFLEADAQFRPYVGAGLTYAKFFKERSTATLSAITGGTPSNPTTLKIESKFGLSLQIGGSLNLGGDYFVDASLVHLFLKNRTTLSRGQTIDTTLDPNAFAVAVGKRF